MCTGSRWALQGHLVSTTWCKRVACPRQKVRSLEQGTLGWKWHRPSSLNRWPRDQKYLRFQASRRCPSWIIETNKTISGHFSVESTNLKISNSSSNLHRSLQALCLPTDRTTCGRKRPKKWWPTVTRHSTLRGPLRASMQTSLSKWRAISAYSDQ